VQGEVAELTSLEEGNLVRQVAEILAKDLAEVLVDAVKIEMLEAVMGTLIKKK